MAPKQGLLIVVETMGISDVVSLILNQRGGELGSTMLAEQYMQCYGRAMPSKYGVGRMLKHHEIRKLVMRLILMYGDSLLRIGRGVISEIFSRI